MPDLRELVRQSARDGRVEAIFVRPARGVPAISVDAAMALANRGLEGDRAVNGPSASPIGSKRQVTLLQAEHVPLLAAWIGRSVDPSVLRRNLVIGGVNLIAARTLFADQPVGIEIGNEVVLVITGPCEPCSTMEAAFGSGAYNAMRGHGGLTARVEVGGRIAVGDRVRISTRRIQMVQ